MKKFLKSGVCVLYWTNSPIFDYPYIKEHSRSGPVAGHIEECGDITIDDVEIIAQTSKSENHLMTLEALHIKNIKPSLNTKDEYKSRTLTIKL